MSKPQGIISMFNTKRKHHSEEKYFESRIYPHRISRVSIIYCREVGSSHSFQVTIMLIKQWIRDLVLRRHPNDGPCHEKRSRAARCLHKKYTWTS